MKIHIIGEIQRSEELKSKLGSRHEYSDSSGYPTVKIDADLIFDFVADACPAAGPGVRALFVEATFCSLKDLRTRLDIPPGLPLFGFCGLPTFVNRELLEVSMEESSDAVLIKDLCESMGTAYEVVADKPGLVTPRVISMIINEAFYTVEEGTASREDIDLAMKLGTNYPYGPFEWCRKIGAANVVRVLDEVHRATADERYRVCKLLRQTASEKVG